MDYQKEKEILQDRKKKIENRRIIKMKSKLNNSERAYLSAVIEPSRIYKTVEHIAKVKLSFETKYRIAIKCCEDETIYLPPFDKKDHMYKNMRLGKDYSLSELGL